MENETILKMNKTQLKEQLNKLPFYAIPKWINTGTKDELAGVLITAQKVKSFEGCFK